MLQNLHPPPSAEARHDLETGKTEYIYDEDLDDEFESVLSRLPENCGVLNGAIITSQGCMLLLVLKEHLKVCLKQSFRLRARHFLYSSIQSSQQPLIKTAMTRMELSRK